MTLKSLIVAIFFTLLIIADGKICWSASEPTDFKSTTHPQDDMKITYINGALDATIKDIELKDVLKEVARLTDLEINFYGNFSEKITLQFDGLPLETGLKRFLKNQNYSLGYQEKKGMTETTTSHVLTQLFIFKNTISNQKGYLTGSLLQKETSPFSDTQSANSSTISVESLRKKIFDEEFLIDGKKMSAIVASISNRFEKIQPLLTENLKQIREKGQKNNGQESINKF